MLIFMGKFKQGVRMLEVSKRAAEAFKEIVAKPENAEKRIRVTFDGGG
jgi:Fe-S cluster assembly iron-binding protein IscA